MRVVFVGDLFTGGQLIENDNFLRKIELPEFIDADIRVCNLEQTTSDNKKCSNKSTIFSPTKGLSYLNQNRIGVVSLANNHIQDKGEDGFFEGLECLRRRGIKYIGAGQDIYEAERPISINDSIVLMAYCDYGKRYLKKVQVACENSYGVNPLSYEKIICDLDKLSSKDQAVIFLHWGEENVWFPPYENISLVKKLLKHPKVHSIIGTHPHRIQGKIRYNNKFAYMSLGNFLFPNFYLAPRTHIIYPDNVFQHKSTKEYHPVFSLTLKKWRYSNRLSLMLTLNNHQYKETFVKQHRNYPTILSLSKIEKLITRFWFTLLSIFLAFPKCIYLIVANLINIFSRANKMMYLIYYYIFKERISWKQLHVLLNKN